MSESASATAPPLSIASSNSAVAVHPFSTVSSNSTVIVHQFSTVFSSATASASATTHPSPKALPSRIVVVQTSDMHLDTTRTSSDPQLKSMFSKDALQQIKNENLAVFPNDTSIVFSFTGTGVAVIGVTHNSVFPPVPTQLLPRWTCRVDGNLIDQSNTPLHSHGADTDIPADGKMRICQDKSLQAGPHNLIISIEVPQVPAFFHSIRYKPVTDNGNGLQNAVVRVDPRDQAYIANNDGNWAYDGGELKPSKNATNMTQLGIIFQGQTLQWFGSQSSNLHSLTATLDGKEAEIDIESHGHSNSDPKLPVLLFSVSAKDQIPLKNHTLVVTAKNHDISLDHLLVTDGVPTFVKPTVTKPHPKAVLIGSIVGGVLGLFLLLAIIYVLIRYVRRRRRRQSWKDSALPSAISHPASRISSRSSFSREVVTGDIEYNPEAQKKMESVANAQIIEPSAVILHADSGVRIQLQASEIPPSYTHF